MAEQFPTFRCATAASCCWRGERPRFHTAPGAKRQTRLVSRSPAGVIIVREATRNDGSPLGHWTPDRHRMSLSACIMLLDDGILPMKAFSTACWPEDRRCSECRPANESHQRPKRPREVDQAATHGFLQRRALCFPWPSAAVRLFGLQGTRQSATDFRGVSRLALHPCSTGRP